MSDLILSVNKCVAEVSLLGSLEFPDTETLQAVELLWYLQFFPKKNITVVHHESAVSVSRDSWNVVVFFQSKKKIKNFKKINN